MREQIRNQLAGNEPAEPVLRGGYLDSREHFFLVWILGNFEEVALVFDQRGRETHRKFFSPGKPAFRDVVALESAEDRERGVTVRELVVFRSTKLSLCCQPIDLEVYALEPSGKLREVLTVPKEHVDVGPGIQYAFLNHVELEAGRGVVTQLVPESSLRWQFEYRSESGRFEPDAATIQSIASERERWHNH